MEIELTEAARQIGLSPTQIESLWQTLQIIQKKKRKSYLLQLPLYLGALSIFFPLVWFYTSHLHTSSALFLSFSYLLLFSGIGIYFWRVKQLKTPGGVLASLGVMMVPLVIYSCWGALNITAPIEKGTSLLYWIRTFSSQCELGVFLFTSLLFIWVRYSFLTALIYGSISFLAGDLTYFLAKETFLSCYGNVAASIGVPLIILGFFLSRKSLQNFAFWSYLFGMLSVSAGLSAWMTNIHSEWDYFLYFSIYLACFLLSGVFHKKIFLFFSSLGIISYLSHLAQLYSNSLLFSFLLAGAGFLLILFSTIFLQSHFKKNQI